MDRRTFGKLALGSLGFALAAGVNMPLAWAVAPAALKKSDEEWKKILTPEQYHVLREEGTEHPYSSPLNDEHRVGVFSCVACDLPLFKSETKFDSHTGWPSFFDHIPDNLVMKKDFSMFMARTEYHCARCGGHHGHLFTDGPPPTGLRHCNNGVALKFMPAAGV